MAKQNLIIDKKNLQNKRKKFAGLIGKLLNADKLIKLQDFSIPIDQYCS